MIHSSVLGESCDPLTRAGNNLSTGDAGPTVARVTSTPLAIPADAILIVIPPGSASAAGKLFDVINRDV